MFGDAKMATVLLKIGKRGDIWMVFTAVLELDALDGEKLDVNKYYRC